MPIISLQTKAGIFLLFFWPWDSCILRYSTQNKGKTKLLRNLNALSRDTLTAWGSQKSMWKCMWVCVCACLRVWYGSRIQGARPHIGRERKSSLNSLNRAAVRACGKVTPGLRFWQKEFWRGKWGSCHRLFNFFSVGFGHFCKSSCMEDVWLNPLLIFLPNWQI